MTLKNDYAYPARTADTARSEGASPSVDRLPEAAPERRRWWRRGQWEVLLLVYAGYDGSRLLVSGNRPQAQQHGRDLLSIERALGLSPEHWLNHAFAEHAWLGIPADFVYATLHYAVTAVVLFWVWRYRREHYARARTWLLLTTALGLVGFVAFPTAPPRLLDSSSGFMDILAQHASIGWWSGGGGVPKGLAAVTNDYAAMPSLHVGWALWCGLLLFRHSRSRVLRLLGLLYPAAIAVVVMGTANHYLLDCVAGVAATVLGLRGTGPATRLGAWIGAKRAARRA
ncbi:phosphatase PAP2 family protein [Kitasatospora sp. NBC_01287]|uniref:phosphatase PAP2 family protein n=1 Tax=Kitasatospora sp. NBC_01287 TaxID=2903573 RepID=UPI002257C1C9|nr:phosphatase PAP2 family protein [Kitasatospora sp. NBC_01287]MCX4750082.1 phosphatase PAP2 family protein [Kitasatospora sp. NBC_01287]